MEKIKSLIIFGVATLILILIATGCASTSSTILEYDASGNIIKQTQTSESVIKTVTDSTKNKSVIMWEDGWAAYISVSSGTTEDPTPHGKIFAGKINRGGVSILPNQTGFAGIAKIIQATKSDVSASLTDGVSATSSEIQAKTAD